MAASLACLRLIGDRFPKNLRVHFSRHDFEIVVAAFDQWLEKVGPKLPKQYREEIVGEARVEFARWREGFFVSLPGESVPI
ncbi:hypothetical protein [Singulisphaera sp. PoT]|uniref:hypothetical protein n=1 Tax=Singulisphaera sp. PoT TaxID=3411797 RepID=UPI003BF46FBD